MGLLALISLILLFHCNIIIVVCTSDQDNDLVVLATASRLKEEIRSQLKEVLAESFPELCPWSPPDNVNTTQPPSPSNDDECGYTVHNYAVDIDSIKEAVRKTIAEMLTPLLSQISHLMAPGLTPSHPASSCKEIYSQASDSPSGYYWIRGTNNAAKHIYCDMEKDCNNVSCGWMRVASIDMRDTNSMCPSGLRRIVEGSHTLCARNREDLGCSSAVFPVEGVQYSKICGKIIGYQRRTPDAFHRFISGQTTVDSNYVDGISVTHGRSPRKHIWTFAAALHEVNSATQYLCPCTNVDATGTTAPPAFVGHDYFCDTGSENQAQFIFYDQDPLWDGQGCGSSNTCCTWNRSPWFMKQLAHPTTDDIEIRLCTDQPTADEDITFETLDIYVQ